jgi:hypothetical protein
MERSYAWIPSCLACDAKVNCQAITNLIGEVGENMNDREQGTGNRETGNREQRTGNREQATENRQQRTGNREQANRQQGTGNREQRTGNREQGTRTAGLHDWNGRERSARYTQTFQPVRMPKQSLVL